MGTARGQSTLVVSCSFGMSAKFAAAKKQKQRPRRLERQREPKKKTNWMEGEEEGVGEGGVIRVLLERIYTLVYPSCTLAPERPRSKRKSQVCRSGKGMTSSLSSPLGLTATTLPATTTPTLPPPSLRLVAHVTHEKPV